MAKTVLLLGAGVTRAARPGTSLRRQPPLDADFFKIAKAIDRDKANDVIECLESLVGEYAHSLSNSLETATTYLYIKALDSASGSIYHTGFLRLLFLVNSVLADTTNDLSVGPRSLIYRFLLSELRKVDEPEDLTIITFNYDLLLERVLEDIAQHGRNELFVFPGCYRLTGISRHPAVRGAPQFISDDVRHKGVALLKLHGSLNWQSAHTSHRPSPTALLSTRRKMNVLNSTSISKSLTWRRKARTMYLKPIIVPPVSVKREMMQANVIELWAKAADALQHADRIVVCGYSCPPLDLEARVLISENTRANLSKKVYVIDPNAESAVKFLDLCGVDHLTVYNGIEEWIRDGRDAA